VNIMHEGKVTGKVSKCVAATREREMVTLSDRVGDDCTKIVNLFCSIWKEPLATP
jgi:hypothetical protein